jgi:hypothetical protein
MAKKQAATPQSFQNAEDVGENCRHWYRLQGVATHFPRMDWQQPSHAVVDYHALYFPQRTEY